MIIYRAHIKYGFGVDDRDLNIAEEQGLYFRTVGRGNKTYLLSDVVRYFKDMGILTLEKLEATINIACQDVRTVKDSGEFDVAAAIKEMEDGEVPYFPSADTAQKTTAAYKNYMEAKNKDIEHKLRRGELVQKNLLMDKVNAVANMYQDTFGEQYFREFPAMKDRIIEAAENNSLYELVRDMSAPKHDAIIVEINKIEGELAKDKPARPQKGRPKGRHKAGSAQEDEEE